MTKRMLTALIKTNTFSKVRMIKVTYQKTKTKMKKAKVCLLEMVSILSYIMLVLLEILIFSSGSTSTVSILKQS